MDSTSGWDAHSIDIGWASDDPVMNAWLEQAAAHGHDDVFRSDENMYASGMTLTSKHSSPAPSPLGEKNQRLDASPAPSTVYSQGSMRSQIVVYDRDNAVEALQMLIGTNEGVPQLSQNEAKGIVKMLVRYIDHNETQRKKMVEKEASLSTELAQKQQVMASMKQGLEDAKEEGRDLKKTIKRLMQQHEETRVDMNSLKMSLEFSKQKEQAALDACKKAGEQVEDVKRRAAVKIDNAHKRLQELEVQMHLAGYAGVAANMNVEESDVDDDADTIIEAEAALKRSSAGKALVESSSLARHSSNDQEAQVYIQKPSIQSMHQNGHEVKLVKSEMALMQRKVDKSNMLLNKTTKAAQKMQEKLSEERRKVAVLQEERSQLKDQIVKLQERPQGMDPKHVGRLVHDLAAARSKVEILDSERARLLNNLASLRDEMSHASEEQKNILLKKESEASKTLEDERAKCEKLQAEVTDLLAKLEDATCSLADLDATRKSLAESQERCAELAGALDQEQRASYDRAMEVDRLAKAAQACANELMSMREELHREKISVQRLETENAGLLGRLEALSEALSAQEHSSEVIESLAEGRALTQSRLKQAEIERDDLRSKVSAHESKLADAESYIEEMEGLLDSLHEDLSKSQNEKNQLEISLNSAKNDVEHASNQISELENLLKGSKDQYEDAQDTVATCQRQLQEHATSLANADAEVDSLSKKLETAEQRISQLVDEKIILAQDKGKLQVEVEQLNASISRMEQHVEDGRSRVLSLEASLKAAEIQCDALRKSNSDAQKDSLSMVDSMCEMSNLIDALNSLQTRVQELQAALASSQMKVSKLEDEKSALAKEVKVYESHMAKSQEMMVEMRNVNEEDNAKFLQVTRRLDTVTLQLEATRKDLEQKAAENADQHAQIVDLLSIDAEKTDAISSLKERMKSLKKSLSESRKRVSSLEGELDLCKDDNETLSKAKSSLEDALQESKQSLNSSEAKLVVSQKRVQKLEEATKHINALAKEFESLRNKHGKILKQQARDKETFDMLSKKYDEAVNSLEAKSLAIQEKDKQLQQLMAELDARDEEIRELQESREILAEEVSRLSSLEDQVALLKEHIADGGSWCETAAATLEARSKEVHAALEEARTARRDAMLLSEQLASAQERASAAESSLAICKENLSDVEMARDAALQTLEVMKEEINILSTQHKEMIDITETVKQAEEDTACMYEDASSRIVDLQKSINDLKEELQGSRMKNSELTVSLECLKESNGQTKMDNDSLKSSVQQLNEALVIKTNQLHASELELHRLENLCGQLKKSLEETTACLTEKESEVECLQSDLIEYKDASIRESKAAMLLQEQRQVLENELKFLQTTLLHDSVTSGQLEEVIKFIGEERTQLRSDINSLNLLVEGMRAELNKTRAECRNLYTSKDEVDRKLMEAMDENKILSEHLSSLQRDMAVLEVVKDQLEREAVSERDEATRSRLYCKEAEQEVAKLKSDYALFNQAVHGRMDAFEPIIQRIESFLSSSLGNEEEMDSDLINVPDISEQGTRILRSLQRVEGRVSKMVSSMESLNESVSNHAGLVELWENERQMFKLVIKLALTIALDNIAGTDSASTLHEGIAGDIESRETIKSSGLEQVWESLSKLVESKAGQKSATKLKSLASRLAESEKELKNASRALSEEQVRSERFEETLRRSVGSILEVTKSIEEISGDVVCTKFAISDCNSVQAMDLCIDSLKASVSIMLRRYRSMARNIGSIMSTKTLKQTGNVGQLNSKDQPVRRNISTASSEKIPAVKL